MESATTETLKVAEYEIGYKYEILPEHVRLETEAEKRSDKWYLAYGSNLNSATFIGRRNISPIKHSRVIVPGYCLTFDISGIPYGEPGFGSIAKREELENCTKQPTLQGVAYLVTAEDYAHIIATEGGGASYKQIEVDAYFPESSMGFKVWTLQARRPRSDCQPSLRYITIIREGAREHQFPKPYQEYLDGIEHFELRGHKQKLGASLFLGFWTPVIMYLFGLQRLFGKTNGISPAWLTNLMTFAFTTMWSV